MDKYLSRALGIFLLIAAGIVGWMAKSLYAIAGETSNADVARTLIVGARAAIVLALLFVTIVLVAWYDSFRGNHPMDR